MRANATICLIHQANYLLDQQITALEHAFIQAGGYTEQLAAAREWFQQAAQKGADIGDLAKVLDDKYDLEADLK